MKKAIIWSMIMIFAAQTAVAQSDVWVLLTDNESEFGPEFIEALRFSYDNGLTQFKTVDTFKPYQELTREQAAKIVGVFAQEVMKYDKTNTSSCQFNDLEWADETLKPFIFDSCKLWIFKGTAEGDFFPSQSLTKAEAIAVVIRMFNRWTLDEAWDPWYLNYYLEARNLELTKEKNIFALERPLTRYEMILLLYRFYVKYSLLEKLNANVWLFDESDNISIRSVGDWVLVLNSDEFLDEKVEEIFAEIDGSYYRLEKSNLILQFENAYTRYGDVYQLDDKEDKDDWTYLWVTTFNLVNWVVSDGNIRLTEVYDRYYQIDISDIRPFYKSEKIGQWAGDSWEATITINSSNDDVSNKFTTTKPTPAPDVTSCSGLSIKGQCQEITSCERKAVKCSEDNEVIFGCRALVDDSNIDLDCE